MIKSYPNPTAHIHSPHLFKTHNSLPLSPRILRQTSQQPPHDRTTPHNTSPFPITLARYPTMNVMLVSPVDTLVIDYVAFGIFTLVNNLWTWVAVLTAAISFWRFRTDKTKPVCVDRVDNKDDLVETTTFKCSGLGTEDASTSGSATLVPSRQVKGFEDNSVTKGKFATYYYEECVESVNERDNGEETALDGIKWWPERLLMRMKMEDVGWYSYQDLTVVNGNVVRLWDGCIRKGKWEYSSGCVAW